VHYKNFGAVTRTLFLTFVNGANAIRVVRGVLIGDDIVEDSPKEGKPW
jgi:hypothetical protein